MASCSYGRRLCYLLRHTINLHNYVEEWFEILYYEHNIEMEDIAKVLEVAKKAHDGLYHKTCVSNKKVVTWWRMLFCHFQPSLIELLSLGGGRVGRSAALMKRSYSTSGSPSSSSSSPPLPKNSRPKPNPDEEQTTKQLAHKVGEHYSARSNQTLEQRESSPIIHLKKLNNWIKSVLIQLYTHEDDSVLDLACGKGGDLIKWHKAKIGYYVGVDIADGSIEDCRNRYNSDSDNTNQRRPKFPFPARLILADCYQVELDQILREDGPFDVCSCQFAMHYSWSTEARARRALSNISSLLRPGGVFIGTMPDANVIVKKLREAKGMVFGNSVYWVRFGEEHSGKRFGWDCCRFGVEYKFHLEDAVDCPEWIVPFNVFVGLAEEYDLELLFGKNSHLFVDEYMKRGEFVELMRRIGALGDAHGGSTISADEWDAAYLYLAFVFRKRGGAGLVKSRASRRSRGKMHISKLDVLNLIHS